MRPFRFLHAADLHLDSPFKGHVEAAGDFAAPLRDATFATFARIVERAIEEKVDFVLLAGDLYDARDRSLRAQLKLRDGLARLDAAGIDALVVHGNHDPLSGRVAQIALPARAHVFGAAPSVREIVRDGEVIATVTGVSYPRAEVTENLARALPDPPEGSPFGIALLHANLGGNHEHANYAPCTLDDLASRRFRYWALGHVHARSVIRSGEVLVAYPGNPQGRSVREAGPRGCLLVDVDGAGKASTKDLFLDEVRWHRPTVSIEGCATIDALEERIAEEIANRLAPRGHEPSGFVFRIELAGRGPLHATLSRAADLDDFEKALRRRFLGDSTSTRFVLIESLLDATGRATDREALRAEATLLGEALRVAEALADPASADREALREAIDPLWKRLRGVAEPPTDAELTRLIGRAAEIAVDLLDEESA